MLTEVHLGSRGADRTSEWYHSATRWTQLTFTDDDPESFDLEFWIDVMRVSQSNALCLSAGGYLAFYPTKIPYHRRSSYLGDSDPFGALVTAARGLGMHVMARVDPHAIHQEAADAHPEWLARDEHSQPIPHKAMEGLWWTDPYSSYHREFITEVSQEIVRRYDVDAIFANRWEGPYDRISYGYSAVEQFRADTGYDLPRGQNPEVSLLETYRGWRSRKLSELVVLWDDAVRAVKPHVRFIPNRGASLTRDLVRDLVEDRYPMFFVDKQGRTGIEPLWAPGQVAKKSRGLYPERPVALISSVGPEDNDRRWKDAVSSPEEIISFIVGGFAQGARPWFTKFKAEPFDTRWVNPIAEAFGLHQKCESVLERLEHHAEVAIFDSRRTARVPFGAVDEQNRTDHDNGIYQALLEARIPFSYIADEALAEERLRDIKVLILPASPDLSPEQVAVIEAFTAGGGSVVAASDTGLQGVGEEQELSLGRLFGVQLTEPPRGPIKNKYMTIDQAHPISSDYTGAQRIVAGTYVLGVEAMPDAETVFRFVPDYPDLPMEELYPRSGATPPAVVAREHVGGGRTVYFAFNLGQVYWDTLQADHARLLANAVRWALGEQPPNVQVHGAGFVDIAVQRGTGECAVTVVNLSNPMAMRGQVHELLPLHNQQVAVRLPVGAQEVSARLLVAATEVPVTVEDGLAKIHIDRIDRLESVHLTWRDSADV